MARRVRWIDSLIQLQVAAGSQGVVELLQGTALIDTDGWTVGRLIVDLYLMSSSVAGAFGASQSDMGIGVISREGVVGSVYPDPNAEEDQPINGWMYRTRAMSSQNGVGGPILTRVQADVRSMRKIDNGRFYLIVNHGNVMGTSYTLNLRGLIRTLVLMP